MRIAAVMGIGDYIKACVVVDGCTILFSLCMNVQKFLFPNRIVSEKVVHTLAYKPSFTHSRGWGGVHERDLR